MAVTSISKRNTHGSRRAALQPLSILKGTRSMWPTKRKRSRPNSQSKASEAATIQNVRPGEGCAGDVQNTRTAVVDDRAVILGSIINYLTRSTLSVAAPIPIGAGPPVHLRVDVDYERLRFAFRAGGGEWQWLPEQVDASMLSDEAGRRDPPNFTGAFVGMCCQDYAGTGHPADFDNFEYREREFSNGSQEELCL